MKHALRNALIAPFTVIMLQINWLLSGVVVTEFALRLQGIRRAAARRRRSGATHLRHRGLRRRGGLRRGLHPDRGRPRPTPI